LPSAVGARFDRHDFAFRTTQSSRGAAGVFYWTANEKAGISVTQSRQDIRAVDLVWRNRVGETPNGQSLSRSYSGPHMVMHITNDLWLNFKLAERACDACRERS